MGRGVLVAWFAVCSQCFEQGHCEGRRNIGEAAFLYKVRRYVEWPDGRSNRFLSCL